jgi:hypothetical protein
MGAGQHSYFRFTVSCLAGFLVLARQYPRQSARIALMYLPIVFILLVLFGMQLSGILYGQWL